MPPPDARRYWVVRTDRSHLADVIVPSLEERELRQGWAYLPEQDLNIIGPIVYEQGLGALTEDQRATWRRVQRFWPDHWEPIATGDLVLLPNVPENDHWHLVEATGGYRYAPHPSTEDHGHILSVRALVSDIANTNVAVSAGLQRTMRNRGAMWNIDSLGPDVEHLVSAGDDLAVRNAPEDRLQALHACVLEDLRDRLGEFFLGSQLEAPVHRLLEVLFPQAIVSKTAGCGEHGADFVIDEVGGFGERRRIVVQLKDHDALNDLGALAQIAEACEWYAPVAVGVILTTAAGESAVFARERSRLSERLGIPVNAILGEQLLIWLMMSLTRMTYEKAAGLPRFEGG